MDEQDVTLPATGSSRPSLEDTFASAGELATLPATGGVRGAMEAPPTLGAMTEQAARIGRFVVLERLGEGGMGVVVAAYDPELDRRVAIKLVQPSQRGEEARRRLLREAQAMAKVSHAHVVHVFDVGTHEGSVYIAMEFLDGGTLRDAMRSLDPADWRARLRVLLDAGEGLAAAHVHGLVHRDFKPDNVLLAKDGRVCVADFGLVRTDGSNTDVPIAAPSNETTVDAVESEGAQAGGSVDTSPSSLGTKAATSARSPAPAHQATLASMTRTGTLLGTPAYMAPEQYEGRAVDALTDQFAFCVTLWEALYGERPFRGATLSELAARITSGQTEPPPRDSKAPAGIRSALERGLALDPSARHPSMADLLAELRRVLDPPRRSATPWVVLGVGGLTVAAVVALAGRPSAAPAARVDCNESARIVAETWSPGRAAALRASLLDTKLGIAERTSEEVVRVLDGWAERWRTSAQETCAATHVRGAQSTDLLDRRMACLESQRASVDAWIDVVGSLQGEEFERVSALTGDLPDPKTCSAEAVLARAALDEVDTSVHHPELFARLETIAAYAELRRFDAIRALSSELAKDAAEVGALEIEVRAALEQARALLQSKPHDAEGSRAALRRAEVSAARLGDVALQAEVALKQAIMMPAGGAKDVETQHALDIASAYEARVTNDPSPRKVSIAARRMQAASQIGELERAVKLGRDAEVLAREVFDAEDIELLTLRADLADILIYAGSYDEGETIILDVIKSLEARFGLDHPHVARARITLSRVYQHSGRVEDALANETRVLEIFDAAYGPDSKSSIQALSTLATSTDDLGRHEEAKRRLIDLFARQLDVTGEKSLERVSTANSLCFVDYRLERLDDAERWCTTARTLAEGVLSEKHPLWGLIANNEALVLRARGEAVAAERKDRAALAIYEGAVGASHPFAAYAWVGIGASLLAQGRRADALAAYERALEIRTNAGVFPAEIAEASWGVARSLPRRDAARAQTLAREAVALWQTVKHKPAEVAKMAADAETWLARTEASP